MSYLREASGDESQFPKLLDIKAQFGFIPNFFRAQTIRPDLIDAEAGLVGAILLKECALTRRQKEYIFLVCSADNLSTYCVTAHCEFVRMLGIEGPEPEQIALDHTVTDVSPADMALLDFAVKLNNHQKDIGRADIDGLRGHGFSDQHILETVIMVGLAKFANFVSIGLGAEPDFDSSAVVSQLNLPPVSVQVEKELNPGAANFALIDVDVDLVERTRAGELDAFDELVRRHQKKIYRTLIAMTRNPEEAEDGVQNVFLKAFQHIGTFQGASRFLTWLTRIAINEGSERLRSRKEVDSLDDQDVDEPAFRPRDVHAWAEDPERLYSQKELREKVERELLKIPAKYRIPIMLRDLQQFSAEETAEILKIGVPALKSRLLRGRLMLREALASSMGRRAANV